MTARELAQLAQADRARMQLAINDYVDTFRRVDSSARHAMMAEAPEGEGPIQGLVAAIVSAVCRELGETSAPWVAKTGSPEPFFAFPARGFALRMRLMLESPPPFRARNVFVPADYLSRARACLPALTFAPAPPFPGLPPDGARCA